MTFTVYHATKTDEQGRLGFGFFPAQFPQDFKLVAIVEAEQVEATYQLTNHIDRQWQDNDGVTYAAEGPQRSTSVGDVVESEAGFYVVAPVGFRQVAPSVNADVSFTVPAVY